MAGISVFRVQVTVDTALCQDTEKLTNREC
jgi:hypothetical protein